MPSAVYDNIPLKDFLQMYFERSASVEIFWNFEIIVIVGLLTVICMARQAFTGSSTRFVFMAGFFVMAASNLQAVREVNMQRRLLRSEIVPLVTGHQHLDKIDLAMSPPSDLETILFHIFFDGIVLVLIWFLPTIESGSISEWLRVAVVNLGIRVRH